MGNERSAQFDLQKANTAEAKVQNGDLIIHAVPPPDSTETVTCKVTEQQKSEISPTIDTKKAKPSSGQEQVDNAKTPEAIVDTKPTTSTDAGPPKQEPMPTGEEVSKFFDKMFKKKSGLVKPSESKDSVDGRNTSAEQLSEPVAIKTSTEAEPVNEGAALQLLEDLADVSEDTSHSEDVKEAEKPVMNFFKTLVSPTKTSKESKAAPDASKNQKETPPASSANVQEAPKVPPPPPPAPPKTEGKAEALKKEETSAAKAAESSTKPKETTFSKLFRPKMLIGKMVSKVQAATASGARTKTSGGPVVVEETKPVEVQVDPSKTSTLEAAAKPAEPPAAPKTEEKKLEKKSTFGNLFKPKVLLGQVTTRIQAAASSAAASVSLVSPRSASEPKKEAAAAPATAESAPVAKAKEEQKPAAPSASAAADNKSVDSTDNASPSISRKLEKRNSIHLFFKNLGQKRHSDAGVQTDPVAPEKAK